MSYLSSIVELRNYINGEFKADLSSRLSTLIDRHVKYTMNRDKFKVELASSGEAIVCILISFNVKDRYISCGGSVENEEKILVQNKIDMPSIPANSPLRKIDPTINMSKKIVEDISINVLKRNFEQFNIDMFKFSNIDGKYWFTSLKFKVSLPQ